MSPSLPAITTLFDLVALAVSLSLGLYIVTRSPRSRVSWLAALTLWCLALFFFHNALAINMPGSSLLPWLQPTMLLVPALWFHLSIELVQERAQQQGRAWSANAAARRLTVILAYVAGVALLLLSFFWSGDQVSPITSAGLHAADRASDPLYPFTTVYVLIVAGLSLTNLWRGYRHDSSEVRRSLAGSPTHIDRGKALNKVLVQAIHQLQPDGVPPNPHSVPPREWHQFIILHDSYVRDEMNRDIMSRLYIGEGTFNRTRRRALQGVARALQEMEEAERRTMNDER